MKIKSTLLSLVVALAFTMPVGAAQYTVPEGQPPVPGADASIPDNAYQNYRYDKTRNITTADHMKIIISGLMERFLRKKVLQRRQSN